MTDEEIWDEALRAYWNGPVDRKKNTQNAMARIRELLAKPDAPISGMTVDAIRQEMRNVISPNKTASILEIEIIIVCADVAHRLAQPVPLVNPDKEAKELAWLQYCIEWPEHLRSHKTADEIWNFKRDEWRNGWRAVAKAKGAGDE